VGWQENPLAGLSLYSSLWGDLLQIKNLKNVVMRMNEFGENMIILGSIH